jgi:cysteine-rich repeat protein
MRYFSLLLSVLACLFIASPSFAYICGNGVLEAGEACDDGSNNNDIAPNACRTDCRKAHCGDGVVDSSEKCDEGTRNSDTIANRCRMNCTKPRCGDGITDTAAPYNEQCDDGNNNDSDGCLKSCKTCVKLDEVGNIEITEDTHICPNSYGLDDYGDYGAIIVKKSGVTLDCHGAELTGEGRGVGVMVFRSNNVTVKNCKLYSYDTGIKGEDSSNVTLISNHLCGNKVADIDFGNASGGAGQNNTCAKPGSWNDNGRNGCTQRIFSCNMPTVKIKINKDALMSAPAAASTMSLPKAGNDTKKAPATIKRNMRTLNRRPVDR